ncbi:hypothetical protein IVG45_21710 [Methylomonas sp. LL1]|uniref:hypothetical protein n=1 Tax=Methylomonas sp. LL1 TaxID=2785785 RepID=UPI0018C3C97A|nr:hypothetical protein [Methylomonas sp. LL1]QPK63383.1 hypothetical protein IVG45_21710 [Methylomonas sp. LL1]
MEFLILLVALGAAYFWIKNRPDKPETIENRDIFPSRGVPLVKRTHSPLTDTQAANSENLLEPSVELEQNQPTIVNTQPAQSEAPTPIEVPAIQASGQIPDNRIETAASPIPEDSVLRRHFIAQRETERQSITHPYPTDSVLRRHLQTMLAAPLDSVPNSAVAVAENAAPGAPDSLAAKQTVPEESVLKRHFIAQLMADIENDSYPRPTDSVLKRHYEHLIQTQLSDRLVEKTL